MGSDFEGFSHWARCEKMFPKIFRWKDYCITWFWRR